MSSGEYEVVLTKRAAKQAADLKAAGLSGHVLRLLDVMRADPLADPPPFEELRGDLRGCYSRRINIHHRLVYQVLRDKKVVRVLSMWTHYQALHEDG